MPKSSSLDNCQTTFQFVRLVEDYIHIEVKKSSIRKLTHLSLIFISETETAMEFDYRSARCMAHVCLGLLEGCAAHFGESIAVEMKKKHDDLGKDVRFKIALVE
ncbi:heme NO-binding domain-containing protein [Vibrio sinaloensis]|nr:heme NO-binding domain-containing protein [Vibrio sinaloensis]